MVRSLLFFGLVGVVIVFGKWSLASQERRMAMGYLARPVAGPGEGRESGQLLWGRAGAL